MYSPKFSVTAVTSMMSERFEIPDKIYSREGTSNWYYKTRTSTSVSKDLTMADECPFSAPWNALGKIRVSASSWLKSDSGDAVARTFSFAARNLQHFSSTIKSIIFSPSFGEYLSDDHSLENIQSGLFCDDHQKETSSSCNFNSYCPSFHSF